MKDEIKRTIMSYLIDTLGYTKFDGDPIELTPYTLTSSFSVELEHDLISHHVINPDDELIQIIQFEIERELAEINCDGVSHIEFKRGCHGETFAPIVEVIVYVEIV